MVWADVKIIVGVSKKSGNIGYRGGGGGIIKQFRILKHVKRLNYRKILTLSLTVSQFYQKSCKRYALQ